MTNDLKTPQPGSTAAFLADERLVPFINYALLFFMVMTYGLTGVIVLMVGTFLIDKAPEWVKSHYQFQIRTFWICIVPVLLFSFLGLFLARSGTASPTLLFIVALIPLIWIGSRASIGFNHLFHRRAHPNPKSWLV